jgi:hypothetical protein
MKGMLDDTTGNDDLIALTDELDTPDNEDPSEAFEDSESNNPADLSKLDAALLDELPGCAFESANTVGQTETDEATPASSEKETLADSITEEGHGLHSEGHPQGTASFASSPFREEGMQDPTSPTAAVPLRPGVFDALAGLITSFKQRIEAGAVESKKLSRLQSYRENKARELTANQLKAIRNTERDFDVLRQIPAVQQASNSMRAALDTGDHDKAMEIKADFAERLANGELPAVEAAHSQLQSGMESIRDDMYECLSACRVAGDDSYDIVLEEANNLANKINEDNSSLLIDDKADTSLQDRIKEIMENIHTLFARLFQRNTSTDGPSYESAPAM